MRLGVTAYPTPTGLGYQTKAYVKHLNPSKVMEIDLTGYNGMPKFDWYENSFKVTGYPTEAEIIEFCQDLDVILFAETPLNYDFYRIARNMGVKTATVINWEFFDHVAKPELPLPDLFIMPSVWHYRNIEHFAAKNKVRLVQLHHPVDREEVPFIERTELRNFFHIAGNPAINDRNGTEIYLQADPLGTITTQNSDMAYQLAREYRHSTIYTDITDQQTLYSLGDVLVLPRRYGGNCLPMNEALSAGLPVIMPDIEPNNAILPKEWLVPAIAVDRFTPRTTVDIYQTDIEALRQKMDWFRSIDLRKESQKANEIAERISWTTLKPEYERVLNDL